MRGKSTRLPGNLYFLHRLRRMCRFAVSLPGYYFKPRKDIPVLQSRIALPVCVGMTDPFLIKQRKFVNNGASTVIQGSAGIYTVCLS